MNSSKWIPRWFDLWNREIDRILAKTRLVSSRSGEGRKLKEVPRIYGQMKKIMNYQACKRLMFDAKQAMVFDKSEPVQVAGEKIHPPFGCFGWR